MSELIRRVRPTDGGPFLNRLNANPDPDRCWRLVEQIQAAGNPSELLARCIPDVQHVVLDGLCHMTTIEDPERTSAELLRFLAGLGA